jgi:WD40 repeat protein
MDHQAIFEKAIFCEALELDPQERHAFLCVACRGDENLHRKIEELLAASGSESRLNKPAATLEMGNSVNDPIEGVGSMIGRYRLLEKIGEGGFGDVWMAQQEEPVRRRVAVKLIKLGMDTSEVVARFDAERQALALMDHPCIARILDGGATDGGRPYFVMELVGGLPITNYCDEHRRGLKERLDLFIQVCEAVQHAHQKGIIHRDIKPTNILVIEEGGKALPKVIDFGVARAISQPLTEKTLFTRFGQIIGTPSYMSPEQAEMSGLDIDTRSDIYSLGVLLYELLVGTTPFRAEELLAAGLDQMRRTIREREPMRPSTRLSTMLEGELTAMAEHRRTDAPRLIHLVRGDLDWIVMKCLEKDRARRYETANGLARDIERHLNHEPVAACPPSRAYQFRKLVIRHKGAFGATCGVALALILGLVASLWEYSKARDGSHRAEAATSELKRTLSASDFSHAVILAEQGNGLNALAYLHRSLTLNPSNDAASTLLGSLLINRSWMPPRVIIRQDGYVRSAQFSPDAKWIVTASETGAACVWEAETGQRVSLMQHGGPVRQAQFSPDGKRVVTACFDGTARVWDAFSGRPVTDWLKHTKGIVYAEFSSEGKRLVTASDDGSARVWDAESGRLLAGPLEHSDGQWVRSARFSLDGKWVTSASKDGTVRVWDATTGQQRFAPLPVTNACVAQFSPDGKRIVTGGDDGAQVWEAESGQPVTPLLKQGGCVRSAQFSPDDQLLVIGADDGIARVWNAQTGQPVTPPLKHAGPVRSVEFSKDGRQVLTGSYDGTVRLWDSHSGNLLVEPLRHSGWVRSARFGPDGQRVVSAADDGTARVWGPRTGQSLPLRVNHQGAVLWAEFNQQGTRILTASADGTARVWDAQTGQSTAQPMKHADSVRCARFSPDGKRIVTASSDGTARLWDARSGLPLTEPVQHDGAVLWAQFSSEGSRVVTASAGHSGRVWDAQSGTPLTPRLEHQGGVLWAEFSPDGQRVVTTSEDSSALLWAANSGKLVARLLRNDDWVESAQFSPDSKRLVTAALHARIWDAQNGRPLTDPLKHNANVWSARFSPDGTRVVTASEDGTARVWDSHSGRALAPPMGHQAAVKWAEFSPDGKRVATVSRDGSARVWDANSGLALTEPLKHAGPVRSAQFSPDGQQVVTASDDGNAAIWDIGPSGSPVPRWIMSLAETLSGQVLTTEGVLAQLKVDEVGTLAPVLEELNQAAAEDPWAELGRWFLANTPTRTISPYSKMSLSDYVENRLKENTLESLLLAERAANGSVDLQQRVDLARHALEARPRVILAK